MAKKKLGKPEADRWEPIRNGRFYCSPACGGGAFCTWADYKKAEQAADKLVAMLGDGWRARVWENLGWHYYAVDPTGCMKVTVDTHLGKTTYTAWIGNGSDDYIGGKWVERGSTPRKAIAAAARKALGEFAGLVNILESIGIHYGEALGRVMARRLG